MLLLISVPVVQASAIQHCMKHGKVRSVRIQDVPYFCLDAQAGLRSQSGSCAPASASATRWANRALAAVKQLWRGKLDDSLIREVYDADECGASSGSPHPIASNIEQKVGRALSLRPASFPTGAAALAHQQGADGPLPPGSKLQARQLPRRGAIWPADVETISLPASRGPLVPMVPHSVHCAEYLNDPERRMMIDAAARDDLLGEMASGEKDPYVDPVLRRDLYLLALRMAVGQMLQGLAPCEWKAQVGLFTVIKEAWWDDNQRLAFSLSLVFDERVPNEPWRPPP